MHHFCSTYQYIVRFEVSVKNATNFNPKSESISANFLLWESTPLYTGSDIDSEDWPWAFWVLTEIVLGHGALGLLFTVVTIVSSFAERVEKFEDETVESVSSWWWWWSWVWIWLILGPHNMYITVITCLPHYSYYLIYQPFIYISLYCESVRRVEVSAYYLNVASTCIYLWIVNHAPILSDTSENTISYHSCCLQWCLTGTTVCE